MTATPILGPLDTVVGIRIEYVLLVLALVNMGTRLLAHRRHVSQADDGGADAMSRHPLHEATNVGMVLGSAYLTTLHPHGGTVLTVLVIGLVITDFFEFEARKVEARNDRGLDKPKAAVVASVVVLMYVAYEAIFFVVKPYWNAIV